MTPPLPEFSGDVETVLRGFIASLEEGPAKGVFEVLLAEIDRLRANSIEGAAKLASDDDVYAPLPPPETRWDAEVHERASRVFIRELVKGGHYAIATCLHTACGEIAHLKQELEWFQGGRE